MLCYLPSAITAEDRRHNQAADGSAKEGGGLQRKIQSVAGKRVDVEEPQKGCRGRVLLFYPDVYDVIYSIRCYQLEFLALKIVFQ